MATVTGAWRGTVYGLNSRGRVVAERQLVGGETLAGAVSAWFDASMNMFGKYKSVHTCEVSEVCCYCARCEGAGKVGKMIKGVNEHVKCMACKGRGEIHGVIEPIRVARGKCC